MKQNVIITVTGTQNAPDTEEATVELTVPGQYSQVGRHHFLVYEEVDEESRQTTRNLVKFREGFMEVTKSGMIKTHMLFEDGKEFLTPYRTPFGEILAEFHTSSVIIHTTEKGLTADAVYTLGMNGSFVADCRLHINVRFLSLPPSKAN